MKPRIPLLSGIVCVALLTGCANGAQRPPTAAERHLFDVTTNVTEQVLTEPRVITITNELAEIVTITNLVTVTNLVEEYVFKPNERAEAVRGIGEIIGSFFGLGGAFGTGIGAIFSLWAGFRSRTNGKAAAELAQIVETGRALLRSLPQGDQYENAWKQWMVKHQNDTETIAAISKLVAGAVDTDSARGAAAQIQAILNAARS